MSEFKNGDLVIDYEGDLTLMVENSEGELLPITLTGSGTEQTRPSYYSNILRTSEEFVEYHRRHNYEYEVVGNISDALKKLHNEISK